MFELLQWVVAKTTAQGLVEGTRYQIVDRVREVMPWGTFFTYQVQAQDGIAFWVCNMHLLVAAEEVARG